MTVSGLAGDNITISRRSESPGIPISIFHLEGLELLVLRSDVIRLLGGQCRDITEYHITTTAFDPAPEAKKCSIAGKLLKKIEEISDHPVVESDTSYMYHWEDLPKILKVIANPLILFQRSKR